MDVEFFCPRCGRMTRFDTAQQPFGKKKMCKGCNETFTLSRETTRDAVFGKIALTHEDAAAREKAVAELADPNVLYQVLRDDPSELVRRAALRRIDEPSAIEHAARADPHVDVRKDALARITDERKLIELSRHEVDPRLRRALVLRIKDEGALTAIACNGKEHPPVRCAALERINNADIVRALMKDPHPGVQAKARERAEELDVEDEVEWD